MTVPEEEKQISLHTLTHDEMLPLIPVDKYSSYSRLRYVTAWMFRFIQLSCQSDQEFS